MYAQDIITLKSGDEIKARVEEISSTEVRYKRFENLQGPTIIVAKSDVFFINYENGTREVITPLEEAPAAKTMKMSETNAAKTQKAQKTPKVQETPKVQRIPPDTIILKSGVRIMATEITTFPAKIKYKRYENVNNPSIAVEKSEVSAINFGNGKINVLAKPNFGIFFNPGGFVSYGPMVGAELSVGLFAIEANVFFPQVGLFSGFFQGRGERGGIGFLVAPKFNTNRIKGGYYVGPFAGYMQFWNAYDSYDGYNDYYKDERSTSGTILGLNTGYKFVLWPGLYFRIGAYLGTHFYTTIYSGRYYGDSYLDEYGYYSYQGAAVNQYKGINLFWATDLTIGFNFLKVRR